MFARQGCTLASILAVSGALLGGCGTYTPDIVPSNEPHATAFFVNKILNHVKCELRYAVRRVHNYDIRNAAMQEDRLRRLTWLDSSAAKVTIKLIVDDKSTLSPGVTLKQLLPSVVTTFPNKTSVTTAQSFSLGLGGTASSEATRTQVVDYSFLIAPDFLGNRVNAIAPEPPCIQPGGVLLESDLKINDWLDSVTFPFFLPDNVDNVAPDVLSHEVAFVVAASGNITPSWTLVQVSANTAGNLAASGRTTTGDVIISLGTAKADKLKEAHNIAKLNSGFNNALKNNQTN